MHDSEYYQIKPDSILSSPVKKLSALSKWKREKCQKRDHNISNTLTPEITILRASKKCKPSFTSSSSLWLLYDKSNLFPWSLIS